MTYLIITGVILLLFFFSRNYWADKIGNFVRNRREGKKPSGPVSIPASVFSPAGVKRTFVIALEIEEGGNGEVIISLAKIKQPEV